MSKSFLDTNILVYTLDEHNPGKKKKCRKLLKDFASRNEAVISTQILQEFYVVGTTKLGIDPLLAKSIIRAFENMEVVTINTVLIKEAIDTSVQYQLSFWDSLVIVAAESAKCEFLYTEDMNHGQVVRNLKIVNPMMV